MLFQRKGDRGHERQPTRLQHRPSHLGTGTLAGVDPFVNATPHLSVVQRLVMMFIGIPLGLLRLWVFVYVVLAMRCLAWLCLLGLPKDVGVKSPIPRWRQTLFRTPMLRLLRVLVACLGLLRVKVNGKPAKKDEAPIIVSNHISFIEPFYLIGQTLSSPVQRIEDAGAPFLGPLFRAAMSIFVDRRTPASRRRTVEAIAARAADPAYPQVLVFPEGTTTNGTALISFKLGAFAAGMPVQPVVVNYPHKWGIDPSCVTHGPPMLVIAFRLFCQPFTAATFTWLPIHYPSEEEKRDPAAFAARVQRSLAEAAGAAITRHTYEDVALGMAARDAQVPPSAGVVEWRAITEKDRGLTLSLAEAQALFGAFSESDEDGDGLLTYQEFLSGLRSAALRLKEESANVDSVGVALPIATPAGVAGGRGKEVNIANATPVKSYSYKPNKNIKKAMENDWPLPERQMRRAFDVLDSENGGALTFRDYLIGSAVLNSRGPQGEAGAAKLLADILDAGNDENLTLSKVEKLGDRASRAMNLNPKPVLPLATLVSEDSDSSGNLNGGDLATMQFGVAGYSSNGSSSNGNERAIHNNGSGESTARLNGGIVNSAGTGSSGPREEIEGRNSPEERPVSREEVIAFAGRRPELLRYYAALFGADLLAAAADTAGSGAAASGATASGASGGG